MLAHPKTAAWLPWLAMLLMLPSLSAGLIGDDHLFRERLTGLPGEATPGTFFGLYIFADGQPAHVQALKDVGHFPWWGSGQLKLMFWRPLAELSHWLDYQLWPSSPALMHLHSLLWFGLLVGLLGRLYRMLDPDPVRTTLSTLVFAVSSLHMLAVIWLAARNQLMAGCCLLVTVMAYHRWRQGGGLRHGLLAMLALGIGLACGEAAIATVGYLAAYALAFEQGKSWRGRLTALLPFIAIVVIWRLVYDQMGYGSHGSGGYIDPGQDPARFLLAMVKRLPTLLLAQLLGVSSSILHHLTSAGQALYALAAAATVGACALAGHHFGLWSTPLVRFLALGAVFALVPVCAAESHDRLLLNAEFGLSAVLATLFLSAASQRRMRPARGGIARAAGALVAVMMVVHLALFPIASLAAAALAGKVSGIFTRDEPMSLVDVGPEGRDHVILVNPPRALFVGYYPFIRRSFGAPNPASLQALASGDGALTMRVLDEHTMRLHAPEGFGDNLSRDIVKQPFRPGERMRAGRFVMTVESVSATGWPTTVLCRFDLPLHDPRLRFQAWQKDRYEPFTLPEVGRSVTLKPT